MDRSGGPPSRIRRELELTRPGTCEGEILTAPRGNLGFGYDPLFRERSSERSMAELELDIKNSLSHRAAAFRALAVAWWLFDPNEVGAAASSWVQAA